MMLSYGVWLVLLGVLGAANLIIAKMPGAKDLIGRIAPYQGWFGAASVVYGLFELVQAVLNMSLMAVHPPFGLVFWIVFLANAVLQIALGILLGVGVVKSFVSQPQAVQKMDMLVTRLAPSQGMLGFAAIGVGVAFLALDILFI